MSELGLMAGQAALQGAGAGLGMLTANWQDRRQVKQARKLQNVQVSGQKEMGKFNQELAMKMWNDTNYNEQRKQMEKAGLNVGMMYGGVGAGGTTQTPTGNVSGQSAQGGSGELGMGMQMGLATAMMQAQIENTKADTEKKKVETGKTAGVDTEQVKTSITEGQTRIEQIKQLTTNEKVKQMILNYDTRVKAVEAGIAEGTQTDIIDKIGFEAKKVKGEMRSAVTQGMIDEKTAYEIIQQTEQNTIEQQLRMGAIKAGIIKTGAETEVSKSMLGKIASEIKANYTGLEQQWMKLDQTERDRWVRERIATATETQTDFNTSIAAYTRQITGIITDIFRSK